jgi:hypothetical protein
LILITNQPGNENQVTQAQQRYSRLWRILSTRDLMGTYGNLSLDAEIATLESDLQVLFKAAP